MNLSETSELIDKVIKDKLCKKYNLSRDSFKIVLNPDSKYAWEVKRGPCPIILFGIMPNDVEFPDAIVRAVKQVKKCIEPMALELSSVVMTRRGELKRVSGVPSNLLDESRVVYKVVMKVTATDIGTGTNVTYESDSAILSSLKSMAHHALSLKIHELEVEE